ncbi:S10 family peptidase [Ferirhizobium litorale]|uniref:S10 family peptidase n=1 Tax=Ferirhizobium litorale TaxID=2927786 RepID=UPI0035303CA0
MRHFIFPIMVLLAALNGPAIAQEAREQRPQGSAAASIFDLIPSDSVTEHVLKTASGDLPYTATAGTLDLFGQAGDRNAKIFYTAYTADDGGPDRPITFAFNGGPGAASAYLHLGLVGPRIVELGPDQNDGTTPRLKDNPHTWLAFTDLVLVDPVGTGWSRAVGGDAARGFYGVRQDAESLAKFIALYTQKNSRLSSPKYLLGESYGGFRAAKVASALKDAQGILVSGIVMVSPMIDGRFLSGADEDPTIAALYLPSFAAAELERKGMFTRERAAEAERFAMTDYLVSLAGPTPTGAVGELFYARVSELTGLPRESVAQARGFVGALYAKQSSGEGRVVSPYDAGQSTVDAYPEQVDTHNDDSILDGYTRTYGAAFASYARDELRFRTEMTYTLLNGEANRRWEWNGGRSNASASGDLRDLLSVIPSFRLLVLHGYSDILTPYGTSRYVLDHLPLALGEGRTGLKVYRGGHMFYTNPSSRQHASDDARTFYCGATVN